MTLLAYTIGEIGLMKNCVQPLSSKIRPGSARARQRPALRITDWRRVLPRPSGGAMYQVVYWTGVATLFVWTGYSAYWAITGL